MSLNDQMKPWKLDEIFHYNLPLREFLYEHCDLKDFLALLRCNWMLYGSFRRKNATIEKKLQLSDIFWHNYVCETKVHENEFKCYLKHLYDILGYNGKSISLYHPDWHAPAVQRNVLIRIEPWMAVYIKYYDASWCAARRQAVLERGFVPIYNETNENSDIESAIDWILMELRNEKVFVDKKTQFIDHELYKFVFWRRINSFGETHQAWLKKRPETTMAIMYEEYMKKVGLTARI